MSHIHREINPYPYDGVVERWFAAMPQIDPLYPDHSDFWRASPEGMAFLLRGYEVDSDPSVVEPGTRFDLALPVWRVGECLLHAERLANALTDQPISVLIRFSWEGLAGRMLDALTRRQWRSFPFNILERSHQDSVTSEMLVPSNRIGENLPEIVQTLTKPLYEAFDFFSLPPEMIREELAAMRSGKY
jgi:hypothetical protein